MGSGPVADLLAVLMVGVAVFCAGRMVLALVWRRPASHDVDLVHVVMGTSMAGMLTGWLVGRWTSLWIVLFLLSTAWFAWRAVHELAGTRSTVSGCGHLPHLVGSASMLYMLVAMHWGPDGAPGSSMPATSAAGSLWLPLVVSLLLFLNALLSAGQVFFGSASLLTPAAPSGAPAISWRAAGSGASGGRGSRGARELLAPRCGALCFVAMSIALAYMFLAMRP